VSTTPVRWLLGDQLGPHFLDDHRGPVLMVESKAVFRRRRFHRAKAHLVLSAMRHRAVELGDRVTYVRSEAYAVPVREHVGDRPAEVIHPTSYAALGLVERLGKGLDLRVLPPRGFATTREDFVAWATGRGQARLLMEDFYREARLRHGVLLDGAEPAGGRWNYDHDNREPPPKGADTLGVPEPTWPEEDEIDEEVRADLDRWERDGDVSFIGQDGPRRFPATRREALAALDGFVSERLPSFGAHEDAVLEGDPWMAHSLVSAPQNLGLLDPLEVVRRESAYLAGEAPVARRAGARPTARPRGAGGPGGAAGQPRSVSSTSSAVEHALVDPIMCWGEYETKKAPHIVAVHSRVPVESNTSSTQ